MKQIRLLATIVVLATAAFNTHAGAPGTINFKFTALFQDVLNSVTNTTHVAGTVTNTQQLSMSTTTNAAINNAALLKMLANSFNMDFPPGASLKLDESGDVLVVAGTNIVLSASNVLAINITTNGVFSDNNLVKTKSTATTNTVHFTGNDIINDAASVDYDDSFLSTRDGNTTRFSAKGLVTARSNNTLNNGVQTSSEVLTFSGSGGGSISNSVSLSQFVLRGGFVAGRSSKIPSP